MEPWRFVHVTDIHIGSPRSYRYAPAWNENWETAQSRIIDLKPDLMLVGGDVARDGNIHKFELQAVKAKLDSLPFPCHVIPGNMDTGNKFTPVSGSRPGRNDVSLNVCAEDIRHFASVFGPGWWSFVHKGVRFSGICDVLLGSGLPQEDELCDWLEQQKELPKEKHHVWLMHYTPFIDSMNEPNFNIQSPEQYLDWYFGMDEPYRSWLIGIFKATGADIVISGHVHCSRTRFQEGIRFDIGPSTAFSQWHTRWDDGDPRLGFLKYDVSDAGISCSLVPLEKTSDAKGYGPGGHPNPDQRDYSIAWE